MKDLKTHYFKNADELKSLPDLSEKEFIAAYVSKKDFEEILKSIIFLQKTSLQNRGMVTGTQLICEKALEYLR